jgi:hypothetical protein
VWVPVPFVRFVSSETVGMRDMRILLAIDSSKFAESAIQAVIARAIRRIQKCAYCMS